MTWTDAMFVPVAAVALVAGWKLLNYFRGDVRDIPDDDCGAPEGGTRPHDISLSPECVNKSFWLKFLRGDVL